MENNLQPIIDYCDEIRLIDFWTHRQKIVDSMILTTGLLNALLKKEIISDEEFSEGFSLAKKQFEKEVNELEQNIKMHTDKKGKLEKELLGETEKQEETEKILQDILGINIDDMN